MTAVFPTVGPDVAERGSLPRQGSVLGIMAWNELADARASYPGFSDWYWNKAIVGIRSGSRQMFVEVDDHGIIGLVIAKRSDEKKICTIWTAPRARGGGVASKLTRDACSWLGTNTPLMSVPEERMGEFRGIFREFEFNHCIAAPSYYRQGKTEYVFNGCLG